jgi:hypothetical protein
VNKKKETPLTVLKALEPFINKIGENFINVEPEKDLIRFADIDKESDFYFNILQYQVKNQFQVLVEYKPYSEITTEKRQLWVNGTEIAKYFDAWIKLLQSYDKVKSPFDDPIIESFKDDYYTEFEIVDEEKDKPLKPKQILLLDAYFEKVQKKIDKHKTESNSEEIEEIKSDITELRDNLSSKTKTWIANRVCWIWAKMTKLGPKLMKDFVNEGNKQIVKESVSQIIEYGKNLIG